MITAVKSQKVNRQKLAAMLYRYTKLLELNTSSKGDLSRFTDGDTTDWARESMA